MFGANKVGSNQFGQRVFSPALSLDIPRISEEKWKGSLFSVLSLFPGFGFRRDAIWVPFVLLVKNKTIFLLDKIGPKQYAKFSRAIVLGNVFLVPTKWRAVERGAYSVILILRIDADVFFTKVFALCRQHMRSNGEDPPGIL